MINKFILVITLLMFSHTVFAQNEIDDFMKANKEPEGSFYSIETAMKTPNKVFRLYLGGRNLKELPIELLKFKNLQDLDLSNNNIQEVPVWIEKFAKLKKLDVRNNKLKEFPEFIIYLPMLKELNLRGNKISKFPSISSIKISSVEILDLSMNNLEDLPIAILKLTRIKRLILENNHFRKIPNAIFKMTNLEFVSLMTNDINDFELTTPIKGRLKGIYMPLNPISSAKISQLRKLIPNCNIVTEL